MNTPDYTTTELAAWAASQGKPVTARYIAKLCQDGQIPARKVGTGRRAIWLIPEQAAQEWLRKWVAKAE
jgi:hypothetical protein